MKIIDPKVPGNATALHRTIAGASVLTLRALLRHETTHQRRRHVIRRLQGRINRLELARALGEAR